MIVKCLCAHLNSVLSVPVWCGEKEVVIFHVFPDYKNIKKTPLFPPPSCSTMQDWPPASWTSSHSSAQPIRWDLRPRGGPKCSPAPWSCHHSKRPNIYPASTQYLFKFTQQLPSITVYLPSICPSFLYIYPSTTQPLYRYCLIITQRGFASPRPGCLLQHSSQTTQASPVCVILSD